MATANKRTTTLVHETREFGAAIELRQAKGDAGVVSGFTSVHGVKDYNGTIPIAVGGRRNFVRGYPGND